jgi:hypothetical protein
MYRQQRALLNAIKGDENMKTTIWVKNPITKEIKEVEV